VLCFRFDWFFEDFPREWTEGDVVDDDAEVAIVGGELDWDVVLEGF